MHTVYLFSANQQTCALMIFDNIYTDRIVTEVVFWELSPTSATLRFCLKVFLSGCGFKFLRFFFCRQRWKFFASATHHGKVAQVWQIPNVVITFVIHFLLSLYASYTPIICYFESLLQWIAVKKNFSVQYCKNISTLNSFLSMRNVFNGRLRILEEANAKNSELVIV